MTAEERRILDEIAAYCETPLEHGIGLVSARTIWKMATGFTTEEISDELPDPGDPQHRPDDGADRAGHRSPDPGDRVHGDRALAPVGDRTPGPDHPWRQYAANRPKGSRVTPDPRPFNPARERLEMRVTPAMRSQLNQMMQQQGINVSEAIRRAVEFWWRKS